MSNLANGSVLKGILLDSADEARERAFAPYSEYKVGASLLTNEGIFTGCNIEVSGRSTSVHAEMLAFFKAVEQGATEFDIMAVSVETGDNEVVGPCGLCQHTMAQFTDNLTIVEHDGEGGTEVFELQDLIGDGYSPSTRHNDKVTDTQ